MRGWPQGLAKWAACSEDIRGWSRGLGKWDACRGLGKWDACKGPVPEKWAVMCNTNTPCTNATTDCVESFIACNMLQRSESNGKQLNAAISQ